MALRRSNTHFVEFVTIISILAISLSMSVSAQDCPELVGRWPYGPTRAVAVDGDYAYFGSGTVLMVADVSNLASPNVVGEVEFWGLVR